ncbi:MAG: hypothetical protein M3401_16000, partial [Actinomycetota bacterium]|nr:hypothetical protein [Actinomycetota bacterium]
MNLPGRHRRSKKAKALDTLAALATAWTETKIVKGAGKGVAKGAKGVAKGAEGAGKGVAWGGKGAGKGVAWGGKGAGKGVA